MDAGGRIEAQKIKKNNVTCLFNHFARALLGRDNDRRNYQKAYVQQSLSIRMQVIHIATNFHKINLSMYVRCCSKRGFILIVSLVFESHQRDFLCPFISYFFYLLLSVRVSFIHRKKYTSEFNSVIRNLKICKLKQSHNPKYHMVVLHIRSNSDLSRCGSLVFLNILPLVHMYVQRYGILRT